MTDFFI